MSEEERKFMPFDRYIVDFLNFITVKKNALEFIKEKGKTTDKMAKEILRIANDEIVMNKIDRDGSTYLNQFSGSIRDVFRQIYSDAHLKFALKNFWKTAPIMYVKDSTQSFLTEAIVSTLPTGREHARNMEELYIPSHFDYSYSRTAVFEELKRLLSIGIVNRDKISGTPHYYLSEKADRFNYGLPDIIHDTLLYQSGFSIYSLDIKAFSVLSIQFMDWNKYDVFTEANVNLFIKWVILKLKNKPPRKLYSVDIKYLFGALNSSRFSKISYNKERGQEGVENRKNPVKLKVTNTLKSERKKRLNAAKRRDKILNILPLKKEQALNCFQVAKTIPMPSPEVVTNISILFLMGKVNRYQPHLSSGNYAYSYWKNGDIIQKEEADFGIKNTGTLERIRKVEEEIAQIHERYEKMAGALQEKELSVKLYKLERQKETEQQKLELLEERLKKWNVEEAKVNKDILR